jgi:hypothetical protein
MVVRRSVALLPSVQRNEGPDGYHEGEGTRVIAQLVREMLLDLPGYEAEVFWPGLEEGPALPMLRKQHRQAEAWLRTRRGGIEQKAVLSIHTDSGPHSRVVGCHGAGHGGTRRLAQALAAAVAPEVARAMRVRDVRVADRLDGREFARYVFCREQPFVSALIECGSHAVGREARTLSDTPEVVADGIFAGIEAYFGELARQPGVVWRPGRLEVTAPNVVSRGAPSRSGRALRAIGPAVLVTDGYTEGGQRVAGSSRWYHLARECGYGWVHASGGRYSESQQGAASSDEQAG